jgi:hypothetical protein
MQSPDGRLKMLVIEFLFQLFLSLLSRCPSLARFPPRALNSLPGTLLTLGPDGVKVGL